MQSYNSNFKVEFKKRLYNFVLDLVKEIDVLRKDYIAETMGKQLLRSGTSIIANYIEAQSASSKKDFINFLTHALKSANESKVWIELLKATNKGGRNKLKLLQEELVEISKIIAASLITLKNNKI